jgi:hypothetical protein
MFLNKFEFNFIDKGLKGVKFLKKRNTQRCHENAKAISGQKKLNTKSSSLGDVQDLEDV